MKSLLRNEVTEYLGAYVTPRRRRRIEAVLAQRTRYVTVVLEDVYQSHNASAVLRSCECFGVQDIHVIEGRNAYTVNEDVAQGAGGWLTLIRHRTMDGESIHTCCHRLRHCGYRLVAATPGDPAASLSELGVESRLAILFGTEEEGLSQAALEEADERVAVPMFGFTESFNVSVSAALILREVTGRMRALDAPWQLTQEEKLDLKLEWYRRSVRGSDLLEKRFLKERLAKETNPAERKASP